MRKQLFLLLATAGTLFAAPMDVSSREFVWFQTGGELHMRSPYPDLGFLDGLQPESLYWSVVGRRPGSPVSSYKFSGRLQSIDGSRTVELGTTLGAETILCHDFICSSSEPGIAFNYLYTSSAGISALVGSYDSPGWPAVWLIVRNEGPALELGFPGGSLQGFGLTWGAAGRGITVTPDRVLLADIPEPSTFVSFVGASVALLCLRRNRVGHRSSYERLHGDTVDKVVALAPTRFPPVATVPEHPMNLTDRNDFFRDWDRQVDPARCPQQVEPSIREVLWNTTIALDTVGSTWGASGVRRAPSPEAELAQSEVASVLLGDKPTSTPPSKRRPAPGGSGKAND